MASRHTINGHLDTTTGFNHCRLMYTSQPYPQHTIPPIQGKLSLSNDSNYQIRGNPVIEQTMIQPKPIVQFVAETNLPTTQGVLRIRAYRNSDTGHEPIAILGSIDRPEASTPIPLRVHDACFTSEVLGSIKCDCKDQLDASITYIQQHGGLVIYLHQEGRGIGLANKLAAYALQEQGFDTVDANRQLHLPDDAREYQDAVAILADLNIPVVNLLTNNPRKVDHLEHLGVQIAKRIPLEVQTSTTAQDYLETKRTRMGHWLPPKGDPEA